MLTQLYSYLHIFKGNTVEFNIFKTVRGYFSNDLSIDLGTANTLIYTKDVGIVPVSYTHLTLPTNVAV